MGGASRAANPVGLAQWGRHLQAPRGGVLERTGVPDARDSGSYLLVVFSLPRDQSERAGRVARVSKTAIFSGALLGLGLYVGICVAAHNNFKLLTRRILCVAILNFRARSMLVKALGVVLWYRPNSTLRSGLYRSSETTRNAVCNCRYM